MLKQVVLIVSLLATIALAVDIDKVPKKISLS